MEGIKQQTLEKLPRRIDGDGDRWYTHEDVLMAIDLAVSKERDDFVKILKKEKPDLSKYEGKEMRFWQGFRKGIEHIISLINTK